MYLIANSQSPMLNPDRNPLLHFLVRKFVYDHFTAGENESEVKATIKAIKQMGYKGVILGYAKEVNVTGGEKKHPKAHATIPDPSDATIQEWKEGTLKTLSMIKKGDILAVKYSGAGPSTLAALSKGTSPPPKMWAAMLDICNAAVKQKSRLWIDAEQQDFQGTIDQWTIDLMRIYNRSETPVVYTTMQAYLKHTGNNILKHLRIAQNEDWTLAIKLVRGAYIATEKRSLIHDTIEATHNSYNQIAKNLLQQSYPGVPSDRPYPNVALFLATHNDESIQRAYAIQKSLIEAGKPIISISYGQLQGMADEVSCSLLQRCQSAQSGETQLSKLALAPHAFKCLTYGSTQECLQFLLRRVKENQDALGRTKYWLAGFRREILRRLKYFFLLA
ncbi:hypothetical protein BP6252_05569 [Coleophoma cylindrospora]|uniref:Proline dehydrogenase n=1 Tax=Coleophoma cylindrospora TaxID=1849047 RepID=A0A3D8RU67_9HELO|nr:hypothetical protein BP6252_05569 [Coleophoma cylindrospora]